MLNFSERRSLLLCMSRVRHTQRSGVRSVWTVLVTWWALVYESCKILREVVCSNVNPVQLSEGRFLLWFMNLL
jgi:hypothetical protein